MEFIDIENLTKRLPMIKADFQSKKPFRFVAFENFFIPEMAELIYANYPLIENGIWDGKTYIDQKNKFQKTEFAPDSIMNKVFKELNSKEIINWLQTVSEFKEEIIADDDLFGGGLHQSINGAFLNIHVDYNIHPKTKYHRRLNLIVYMNKNWKDEYGGNIELWDLTKEKKEVIAKYPPSFNRCVIFETNEISFHGHPTPLKTPIGVNRKSLATYYYSKTRPENEIADAHNTIYINTEGMFGQIKRFNSGIKSFLERVKGKYIFPKH
jgi:Rps23 Pro-64 3,4-dihydroxylase Tpa1-like proline 4-hydroxylase